LIVLDEHKKQALAIVTENNFALAIGKQGLNVRLANKLVDWNIDVKTEKQFGEMDISAETKKAVSALFGESREEISAIAELPGIDEHLVTILRENGIELIEDLISKTEKELLAMSNMTTEDAKKLMAIIEESVEIVEDDKNAEEASGEEPDEPQKEIENAKESEEETEEQYECPVCHSQVTPAMVTCPNCGIGLSFEDIDEEEKE
jgi:transcription termination/antitermination protein NusA